MQAVAREVVVEARVVVEVAVAKVVAAAVVKVAAVEVRAGVKAVAALVREMVEDGLLPPAIPLGETVLTMLLPSSRSTALVLLAGMQSEKGISRGELGNKCRANM